nr:MAG TPA: hypothetical protein [Caudoviricetes sp.]
MDAKGGGFLFCFYRNDANRYEENQRQKIVQFHKQRPLSGAKNRPPTVLVAPSIL